MKTFIARVIIEVRCDSDDDDEIREAIKEALTEAIEYDTLDYNVDETDEEDL